VVQIKAAYTNLGSETVGMPKDSTRENHVDLLTCVEGPKRRSAVTLPDEGIVSWAECTFLLDSSRVYHRIHHMREATATISSTIIHLRTVLQPEISRSPERPERARSSIAAQTQPFEKQQIRMLHFSIPCSLRHRRH
jgi:hypothetical protein